MSVAEDNLEVIISMVGLLPPVREYSFARPRRWRFDLAWPDVRLAVEVEGGTWVGGRHTRPAAYEADCEKYNEATLRGWRVLRVTPHMVNDGRALAVIERALLDKEGSVATGDQRHAGAQQHRRGPVPRDAQRAGAAR